MIDLEHSPLGGSGAHRFMNCAGSFLLQRSLIENDDFEQIESEYARLGTAAHELCAETLMTDTEPFEFFGKEIDGYKVGWPDGIDLDSVQISFNECTSIMERHGRKGWMIVEQTFHLKDLHPLLRGTVDFGFITGGRIYLRDYKNGAGVGVSAANNQQLLYYAFLLAKGDKGAELMSPDSVVSLGIVQPNFYGVFEEPDVWETTLGYVLEWGHNVLLPKMHSLTSTQDVDDSDFVDGNWCQFCPVMLECPKAQKAFKSYVDGSEDFITMLTDDELNEYYSQRELARRFMNALESTVHARLVAGRAIPSAKLVEKRANRVWKPGADAALKAAFGEKAYEPKKIKTPAKIEKLSSLGKELALEWGYKPESAGLSVAPISDPRPEAKPKGNATVFENFAQSPEQMGF